MGVFCELKGWPMYCICLSFPSCITNNTSGVNSKELGLSLLYKLLSSCCHIIVYDISYYHVNHNEGYVRGGFNYCSVKNVCI